MPAKAEAIKTSVPESRPPSVVLMAYPHHRGAWDFVAP